MLARLVLENKLILEEIFEWEISSEYVEKTIIKFFRRHHIPDDTVANISGFLLFLLIFFMEKRKKLRSLLSFQVRHIGLYSITGKE